MTLPSLHMTIRAIRSRCLIQRKRLSTQLVTRQRQLRISSPAVSDMVGDAWERIESLAKKGDGIRGVPTGFAELDNLLSGLHPSDLIILAARPSMGKSSLALDIARNAAIRHNVPVGIFTLEMSSEQLVDRMLAAESFVNSWKLRTGAVHAEEEFGRIRDALESTLKSSYLYR